MWGKIIAIGLGGFAGANARYWIGGWIAERAGPYFPYHTFVVNISGSFLLGLFMTVSLQYAWRPQWQLAFAVGFLGAYTTFSTYEYESLNLLAQGSIMPAAANLLGSVAAGLLGVWLGVVAGRLLTGA